MCVCSLTAREREGRLSPNFQCASGMVLSRKNLGTGSWIEARKLACWHFSLLAGPAGHAPRQADGHWTGYMRTYRRRQRCADAIETGVGADGPVRAYYTRVREACPWAGEKWNRGSLRNARLGGQNG